MNKTEEFIHIARELGREKFLPRSRKYDLAGEFPRENYADLKDAGFLGLTIPETYGGMGADYASYCRVSAELGFWCGATALTFNMHTATMLWTGLVADQLEMSKQERAMHEQKRSTVFNGVITHGHLFAQPFSEPESEAAAGKIPFGTSAEKVEGGFEINGSKHFASLAGEADFYGILCTLKAGKKLDSRNTVYLAVPENADGFTVHGDWDVLGMRATSSRQLRLESVFVPDSAELLPPGKYHQAALNWPHMFMTLCPTYVGIARAAYSFTCRYLRGEVEEGPPAGESLKNPTKQISLAQMRIKLEQTTALFEQAISEAKYKPSKAERLRAYATHYTVMESANDLCRDAIRICGGRAIFKTLRLEQLYRDSRCGSLMLPWTPDICLERLGKESLKSPIDIP